MYNERLYSREGAAELLGISVSTLADYELGNTKVVPVDKVVLMADLYNAPELKTGYCKHECPICSYLPVATEAKCLEISSVRYALSSRHYGSFCLHWELSWTIIFAGYFSEKRSRITTYSGRRKREEKENDKATDYLKALVGNL